MSAPLKTSVDELLRTIDKHEYWTLRLLREWMSTADTNCWSTELLLVRSITHLLQWNPDEGSAIQALILEKLEPLIQSRAVDHFSLLDFMCRLLPKGDRSWKRSLFEVVKRYLVYEELGRKSRCLWMQIYLAHVDDDDEIAENDIAQVLEDGMNTDPALVLLILQRTYDRKEVAVSLKHRVFRGILKDMPPSIIVLAMNLLVEKTIADAETSLDFCLHCLGSAINQPHEKVKAVALRLIPDLKKLTDQQLQQLLSKQPLSVQTAQDPAKKKRKRKKTNTETENQITPDGDRILIEESDYRYAEDLTHGVLVLGLEDEFESVRNAAIDTLRAFSLRNQFFAESSIPFLIDMFNDEAHDVRLNALNSIRTIAQKIPVIFEKDRLNMVLMVLKDAHSDQRKAAIQCLGSIYLKGDKTILLQFFEGMLAHLLQYQQDKMAILELFKECGHKYFRELSQMTVDLFQTRAHSLTDPKYTALHVMTFAAMQRRARAKMEPLQLPRFVEKHIPYFEKVYPDLYNYKEHPFWRELELSKLDPTIPFKLSVSAYGFDEVEGSIMPGSTPLKPFQTIGGLPLLLTFRIKPIFNNPVIVPTFGMKCKLSQQPSTAEERQETMELMIWLTTRWLDEPNCFEGRLELPIPQGLTRTAQITLSLLSTDFILLATPYCFHLTCV